MLIKPRILCISEPRVRFHKDSFRALKGTYTMFLHFQAYTELASERQSSSLEIWILFLPVCSRPFKELGISSSKHSKPHPLRAYNLEKGINSAHTIKYIMSGSVNVQKRKIKQGKRIASDMCG